MVVVASQGTRYATVLAIFALALLSIEVIPLRNFYLAFNFELASPYPNIIVSTILVFGSEIMASSFSYGIEYFSAIVTAILGIFGITLAINQRWPKLFKVLIVVTMCAIPGYVWFQKKYYDIDVVDNVWTAIWHPFAIYLCPHFNWEFCRKHEGTEQHRWASMKRPLDIAGLESFIQSFPNGYHAHEARKRLEAELENRDWNSVRGSIVVDQIRKFLEKYPNSPMRAAAADRIAMLERERVQKELEEAERNRIKNEILQEDEQWKKSSESNTKSSYNDYLGLYPDGRYSTKAKQAIKDIDSEGADWKAAQKNRKLSHVSAFIQKYPKSEYRNEARKLLRELTIEEDAWKALPNSGPLELISEYARKYPKSWRCACEGHTVVVNVGKESGSNVCVYEKSGDSYITRCNIGGSNIINRN